MGAARDCRRCWCYYCYNANVLLSSSVPQLWTPQRHCDIGGHFPSLPASSSRRMRATGTVDFRWKLLSPLLLLLLLFHRVLLRPFSWVTQQKKGQTRATPLHIILLSFGGRRLACVTRTSRWRCIWSTRPAQDGRNKGKKRRKEKGRKRFFVELSQFSALSPISVHNLILLFHRHFSISLPLFNIFCFISPGQIGIWI